MNSVLDFIIVFVTSILLIILSALLLAIVTMLLWNWLMPVIFGLGTITFLQAWGINILTGILFKSTTSVKKSE